MERHFSQQWDGVHKAFSDNFSQRGEHGAALCIYIDGVEVLHLWDGYADPEKSVPWERDTIVAAASSIKGLYPFCVHHLVARGRLDYDRPVAEYWPGFGAAGKEGLTVRHLVSHWAGLEEAFVIDVYSHEIEAVMTVIEQTQTSRSPGTLGAYHSQTYMPLVAGLVFAVTGEQIETYFRREIAGPWAIDAHLRLPESEYSRVASTMVPGDNPYHPVMQAYVPTEMRKGALVYPPRNSPLNAYASARAYARLFGGLAAGGNLDGLRLFEESQVAQVLSPQWINGLDLNAPDAPPLLSGAMGWFKAGGAFGMGPNPNAVGAPGAGGNFGLCDPDYRLGVGYVLNSWASPDESGMLGPRTSALLEAIYAAI